MKIAVAGMSHRTAPVDMRERMAYRADEIPDALKRIRELNLVEEAALISTCNRVEIYIVSEKPGHAAQNVKEFLARDRPLSIDEVERHSYVKTGSESIRHLYGMSAGLDSMVLGEPQILGQVKDSYRSASGTGSTGIILNKLFHRAFQSAKRIRTETRIGNYAVSVAATAVDLAVKIFGNLNGCTVLLVGAGNMGELAAQHLVGAGIADIIVVNRTFETAGKLAERFGGEAMPIGELGVALQKSDIVIATTGAPEPVISHRMVSDAIKARRYKPIFLIDIAVPRDIEPKVQKLELAYLYDIDDLEEITEEHKQERVREAQVAELIVAEEAAKFEAWLSTLEVVPTIVGLRSRFEEIAGEEVEKAVASISNAGEQERNAIELLAHNIINKLLHEPTTMLKKCAEDGQGEVAHACRVLFKLQADLEEEEAIENFDEETDD